MALLGMEAQKIPGSFKVGTGTITFVSAATAYAKPDQTEYGREVYIHGGLSDKSCLYKLTTKYKIGDRVTFTYVPATRPDRGCKWAVINLSKIGENFKPSSTATAPSTQNGNTGTDTGWNNDDDDRKSTSSDSKNSFVYSGRSGIIHQAKGRIDYNGIAFAYIHLDPPLYCRAFMADQSVTGNFKDENGTFSLAKAFPVGTRIICDLQPQKERKGCKFFAKNVVIDYSKVESNSVSSKNSQQEESKEILEASQSPFTPPRLPLTNQEFSPVQSPKKFPQYSAMADETAIHETKSFRDIENLRAKVESMKLHARSMSDIDVQTDPTVENQLLEKIFADEEIFRLICTRHPEVMYRYMRSGFAPTTMGK